MMKSIVKNRTGALKTDANLFSFDNNNIIVKFMFTNVYIWTVKKDNCNENMIDHYFQVAW